MHDCSEMVTSKNEPNCHYNEKILNEDNFEVSVFVILSKASVTISD